MTCVRPNASGAKEGLQHKYTQVAAEYSLQNGPSGMEVKCAVRDYMTSRESYFETHRRIPACT